MRKLFRIAAWLALAVLSCFAQNGNNFGGAKFLYPTTVANLPPAAASINGIYVVTDGNSSTDCTVGGGSNRVVCLAGTSVWAALGGGGGGGITNSAGANVVMKSDGTNAVASNLSDSGTAVQSIVGVNYFADTGAADAYVITPSPAISAYAAGQQFTVKAANANATTTPTLNVNGKGAKTIFKNGAAGAMVANDIKVGSIFHVTYDGTNFQFTDVPGNTCPGPPTANTQVQFDNNGACTGIVGSAADNITNLSSAASNMLLLNRTYTAGDVTNPGHIIDTTLILNNATNKENTASHYYGRLTYTGSAGCSHCLGVLSRSSDQGTGGTIDQWDGFYADHSTTGNPATAFTQFTQFHAVASALSSTNAANIYANWANFRSELTAVTNSSAITNEFGFITAVRGSNDSHVTTHHALDVGVCTHANVYLSGIVCGQQWEFQIPVYQTYTMGATSATPSTASQLYAIRQNNFLADGSTVFNITSLLTHSNGGTGTSIGIDSTVDNGGNSTATKMSALRARCQDTGSGNTVTKCIGLEVQSANNSGNTITNISGIEMATQVSGTNTNPAIDVNLTAAASANEFGVLSTPISQFNGNRVQVTAADWTCGTGGTVSSCTTAQTIGSLTFTLPKSVQNWHVQCNGVVGQATAATANSWNFLTATTGATNVTASYNMLTAATAMTGGATTDTAATTTTVVIGPTWTLGGTATKMPFQVDINIEGAAAAGTVVSLQLVAPTVVDLVTIYRGATCQLQ